MANRSTLLRDLLYFVKNDLSSSITDPIDDKRSATSRFVMTSYPLRKTEYPLITVKIPNLTADRSGMQTTTLDIIMTLEIRIWARNEKEKNNLYEDILDRLANIQFTASGSVENDFHDFSVLSSTEIDEDGDQGIKSRILQVQYKFFDA